MQLPEEMQTWRRYGKCVGLSIEKMDQLFFFGTGGSPVNARRFCASCPVKRECLQFAVVHNQEGVWAGTTEEERRELRSIDGYVENIIKRGMVVQTFASPEPLRLTPETSLLSPEFSVLQSGESAFPIFDAEAV